MYSIDYWPHGKSHMKIKKKKDSELSYRPEGVTKPLPNFGTYLPWTLRHIPEHRSIMLPICYKYMHVEGFAGLCRNFN